MCKIVFRLICLTLILSLGINIAKGTDPSLVAWYRFDGDASDSSGNDLHGTEVGDPTYVGGVFGQALDLDGDGDYIDCGNPPEFDIRDQITFTFWFQVRSFDAQWNTVIAKGDNSWRSSRADTNNFMEAAVSGPLLCLAGQGVCGVYGRRGMGDRPGLKSCPLKRTLWPRWLPSMARAWCFRVDTKENRCAASPRR